ncbi:hypothetical protein [Microbacterium gorillae]|uniref:hypothetical protein n=1 Tax=Microbacterium gorillae TaxID=1231063 RepID=UPI000AFDDEF1|nr:hypothetical protein [Microbacterium gorillae]
MPQPPEADAPAIRATDPAPQVLISGAIAVVSSVLALVAMLRARRLSTVLLATPEDRRP